MADLKAVLGFLAGFIVAIGIHAVRAVDLEVALGGSEFCCKTDGIWWQSPFGFTGSVREFAFELGARQRFGDWSVHAAYANLGVANGLNVATMRDADFGRFNSTQRCDPNSQKNCLGYFMASQYVAGVLAGVAYGRSYQGIRVEGEVGQFLYRADMNVAIWCPNCGVDHRYAFGAGGAFSSTSGMRRSPYFAVKASHKDVFLTYRRFSAIDGSGGGLSGIEAQFATGLTNGPVNQFMIGVTL